MSQPCWVAKACTLSHSSRLEVNNSIFSMPMIAYKGGKFFFHRSIPDKMQGCFITTAEADRHPNKDDYEENN